MYDLGFFLHTLAKPLSWAELSLFWQTKQSTIIFRSFAVNFYLFIYFLNKGTVCRNWVRKQCFHLSPLKLEEYFQTKYCFILSLSANVTSLSLSLTSCLSSDFSGPVSACMSILVVVESDHTRWYTCNMEKRV